ncbi:hypothetical protein ACFLS4_04135 [Bacteroidota bacterium]
MRYIQSFILFVSFMVFAIIVNAQDTQTKSEKEQEYKSQKIAFFTDKIGLTPEEAQIFWPIYNNYWDKKNSIIADRKEKMTYFADHSEDMSNDEMIKYADQYINYEMQLAELLDEYHKKFKKILPIEKVMKIYLADYEYKTYLLKKIRESGKEDKNE